MASDTTIPQPEAPTISPPEAPEKPGKEKQDPNPQNEELSNILQFYLDQKLSTNSSQGNASPTTLPLDLLWN